MLSKFIIFGIVLSTLIFGGTLFLFVNKTTAYVCTDTVYCGCGSGYQDDGGCSCGDGCDYSCQFSNPDRCDGDDPGGYRFCPGGPCPTSVPQWTPYNFRVYIQKDNNHNGVPDSVSTDSPITKPRPGTFQIFCNGTDRFGNIFNSNTRAGEPFIRIGSLTSPTTAVYYFSGNHQISSIWGGGVEMCEYPVGGQGSPYGYARTRAGRISESVIIHISLNDTPPLGIRPYTFRQAVFTDLNFRGVGSSCTLYTQPVNGVVNDDRNRLFYCSVPSVPTDRYPDNDGDVYIANLIQVAIDNQDSIANCASSWCDPSTATTILPGGSTTTNITGYAQMSFLMPTNYRMRFDSSDPSQIDFSASSLQDTITTTPTAMASPLFRYQSLVTGYITTNSPTCGTPVTVRADLLNGSGAAVCGCDTATITVACIPNPPAWWQVNGGDAVSVGGNIVSKIGGTNMLGFTPFFGVPIFTGSLDLTPGTEATNLSNTRWKTDSSTASHLTAQGDNYDYDYFWNKFHTTVVYSGAAFSNTTITTPGNGENKEGYDIYYKNSSLSVTGINLSLISGPQKVVVFVEGDLIINGKVLVEDGVDFIMFIVRGNISVAPGVGDVAHVSAGTADSADLEGIYLSNQKFITNANGALLSNQLYVRGLVLSFYSGPDASGITFQRDLAAANGSYPAEIFEYAPDQLLLFPSLYSEKSITWREAVP